MYNFSGYICNSSVTSESHNSWLTKRLAQDYQWQRYSANPSISFPKRLQITKRKHVKVFVRMTKRQCTSVVYQLTCICSVSRPTVEAWATRWQHQPHDDHLLSERSSLLRLRRVSGQRIASGAWGGMVARLHIPVPWQGGFEADPVVGGVLWHAMELWEVVWWIR